MLEVLESMTFGTTTFVVALISGTISGVIFYLVSNRWRWISPVMIPVIISYLIYWAPVRNGADPSEYSAWAGLFLFFWSCSGIMLSCVICLLIQRVQKR